MESSFPSPNEMEKLNIKEIVHKTAVTFTDAGIKPDMVRHRILRDALAREYSRRLRLSIGTYPPRRVKRYVGHKNMLDLSWRQLEKIRDRLKNGARRTRKVRRKRRRRRRKSQKIKGRKAP